jgi:hypothetical protein
VAERLNKMSAVAGGTYYAFLFFCLSSLVEKRASVRPL